MPCKEQTHIERLCQGGDPLEVSAEKRRDNYYLRVCKLTADDIPALIEIACRWPSLDWSQESDPFGVDVNWDARLLPVSAWRSLGELQAEAAIEPLIGIIVELGDEFDDWVSDELPAVFAQIGPASVEPLLTLASDQDACDLVRESAVRALGCVAVKHPETSPRVVPFLTAMINSADQNAIQLNTSLMSELVGLNAREAAEAIEKAFAANRIDVAVMGDWERVREALGVDGQGLAMPANPFDSLADLRQEWRAAAEPETNFLAIQCPDETETPREKVGRNDPCPCGSGKKYKKCCLRVASGP